MKDEAEFKDLTGDPLFDYIMTTLDPRLISEDLEVVGRIIEHKKHSPGSPRKELEIRITDGKRYQSLRYNYNKILKEINGQKSTNTTN